MMQKAAGENALRQKDINTAEIYFQVSKRGTVLFTKRTVPLFKSP
jgi:hypothetical protein